MQQQQTAIESSNTTGLFHGVAAGLALFVTFFTLLLTRSIPLQEVPYLYSASFFGVDLVYAFTASRRKMPGFIAGSGLVLIATFLLAALAYVVLGFVGGTG
ncbi:MAG: hypothetical protein JRN67_00260, partial [Nitrososphaerota archaeon]|nr:hypothetical protein [Nitrososphaerota archaeon]